jgi:integrase
MRRRPDGTPAHSQARNDHGPAKDRRAIQRRDHAATSSGDGRHAGEQSSDVPVTAQGDPFTAAGFGNWFRDMCREAKLPKRCTSHGLRKAAATYLAEQGATDHQLMAWFGWSSISQAQVYTKAANRKRMVQSAARLITGTGIGSPVDPVSQKCRASH